MVNQLWDLVKLISSWPFPLNWIAWVVVVGVIIGIPTWRNVKFIHVNEVGIPLRNGKPRLDESGNVIYKHPGLRTKMPGIDKIIVVDILDRVVVLDEIRVDINAFIAIEVKATLIFKVIDAYKTMYVVNNLEDSVRGVCEDALQDSILAADDLWTLKPRDRRAALKAMLLPLVNEEMARQGLEARYIAVNRFARNTALVTAGSITSLGHGKKAKGALPPPQ